MTFHQPPTPERLAHAARLFDDGASQTEVHRTTGISRDYLRKHFPRRGWTYKQAGEFRQLTKTAQQAIERITA